MPKLKDKPISGVYDLTTKEGKIAASRLKYCIQDNNIAHINIIYIKSLVDAYINKALDDNGHYTKDKLSVTGYANYLHVDYNTTLIRWAKGYVNDTDEIEGVECNIELRDAICAGLQAVAQFYEERTDKYTTSKDIEFLRAMGILPPNKTILDANIRIGSLTKPKNWKKGSK
jgi:hypothetical protein